MNEFNDVLEHIRNEINFHRKAVAFLMIVVGLFLTLMNLKDFSWRGFGLRSATVQIPNVEKFSKLYAVKTLEDDGFKVTVTEQFSDTVKAGDIISQSPKSGAKAKRGDTVYIYVSKGRESNSSLVMSDVVGATGEYATNQLKSHGYTVSVTEVFSDTVQAGYVVSQTPNAGALAERGDTVYLYVSKGRDPSKSSAPAYKSLSLGGIHLGDTIEQMRSVLGRNYTVNGASSTADGEYRYSDIYVTFSNNSAIGVVSYSSRVKTDKGISEGSTLNSVVNAYGRRCSVMNFEGLTLYEYPYEMPDRSLSVMRFAVNRNGIVEYISLRTVTAENDKHEILASMRTL